MNDKKPPVFLQPFLQPGEHSFGPYQDDGDYTIDLSLVHSSTEEQVNHAFEVFADIYDILKASGSQSAFYDLVFAMEKLSEGNTAFIPSQIIGDQSLILDLLEKSGLVDSFHMPPNSTVYARTPSGDRFFSQVYAYMKYVFAIEHFPEAVRYVCHWDKVLTLNFIRHYLIPQVEAKLADREFERICRETKTRAYESISDMEFAEA